MFATGIRAAVRNFIGTGDRFCGRQFFHEPGVRVVFQDDSSTLHLLWTLFLLLLHQLHLRSSGISSWGLENPGLEKIENGEIIFVVLRPIRGVHQRWSE